MQVVQRAIGMHNSLRYHLLSGESPGYSALSLDIIADPKPLCILMVLNKRCVLFGSKLVVGLSKADNSHGKDLSQTNKHSSIL